MFKIIINIIYLYIGYEYLKIFEEIYLVLKLFEG